MEKGFEAWQGEKGNGSHTKDGQSSAHEREVNRRVNDYSARLRRLGKRIPPYTEMRDEVESNMEQERRKNEGLIQPSSFQKMIDGFVDDWLRPPS